MQFRFFEKQHARIAIFIQRVFMTDSEGMPHYPVLGLIRRHGKTGAAVIGLGLFALGAVGAWALQFWPCVILGAIVGLLAWGLLLSYVEMIEIIFDTLVPR
jgi:hypothetical protein